MSTGHVPSSAPWSRLPDLFPIDGDVRIPQVQGAEVVGRRNLITFESARGQLGHRPSTRIWRPAQLHAMETLENRLGENRRVPHDQGVGGVGIEQGPESVQ